MLAFVPIDDVENHPAFKHLGLEIGRLFLPVRGVADLEFRPPWRSAASSAASAPRAASYIKVRLSFVNA